MILSICRSPCICDMLVMARRKEALPLSPCIYSPLSESFSFWDWYSSCAFFASHMAFFASCFALIALYFDVVVLYITMKIVTRLLMMDRITRIILSHCIYVPSSFISLPLTLLLLIILIYLGLVCKIQF
jgi:hypothetical protein